MVWKDQARSAQHAKSDEGKREKGEEEAREQRLVWARDLPAAVLLCFCFSFSASRFSSGVRVGVWEGGNASSTPWRRRATLYAMRGEGRRGATALLVLLDVVEGGLVRVARCGSRGGASRRPSTSTSTSTSRASSVLWTEDQRARSRVPRGYVS